MKYNLFILLPNLSDEEVKAAQVGISEIIKKVDGKIESFEETGKRKLSYGIKNVRYGFYLDYVLSLDKNKIKDLKKELKLNHEILRFEFSLINQKINKAKKQRAKKEKEKMEAGQQSVYQEENKKERKEKPKISMEELDRKLDNILEVESV